MQRLFHVLELTVELFDSFRVLAFLFLDLVGVLFAEFVVNHH